MTKLMTKVSVRYVTRAFGALLLGVAIAATPALAQHGGGGGGGGGGHMGGGGGAHFGGGGGGGGGHFGGFGGGAHFGGFGGGHAYGGHTFAAPHYGVPGHYYGGYAGGHYLASAGHGFAYGGARYVMPHSGFVARPGTHPGVGAPSAPSTAYWHGGAPWAGGYWHGAYWPHAWYYPGWAWYLPVLPVGYVTYWWGGVPYYYWNSLYYTWSPADSGYVVTNPPPAAGTDEGSADANGGYEQAAPQSNYGAGAGTGDVYVYPRNGQTEEQTQNDRYECHSWAVSQSGFDPTRPQQQTGNPEDYRRAMVACLDARGYSSR